MRRKNILKRRLAGGPRRIGLSVGVGAGLVLAGAIATAGAAADEVSLAPGYQADALRGKALAVNRQKGFCLLCHSAPIPEERFQGDIAPDLAGVGERLGAAELRARLVDPRRFNPQTLMPAYHRIEHLRQVGSAWQGRTLLSAQEIEDVVAWLLSLRDPAGGTQGAR